MYIYRDLCIYTKYKHSNTKHRYCSRVFETCPTLIQNMFMYTEFDIESHRDINITDL